MNLEEAIKNREDCLKYLEEIGPKASPDCLEAVRWSAKALKALRPVSRDRVEKVRSRWITVAEVNGKQYSKCAACQMGLDGLEDAYLFCPHCGAPMTDEAVDMVMERWEALKDGEDRSIRF